MSSSHHKLYKANTNNKGRKERERGKKAETEDRIAAIANVNRSRGGPIASTDDRKVLT